MNDTIRRILYLTHDKWEGNVEIKYREEFKDYLEEMVKLNPKIIEDLEIVYDLGYKEDHLVIMKGVLDFIKKIYPTEHLKAVVRLKANKDSFDYYKAIRGLD